jgi:hypothetical protein
MDRSGCGLTHPVDPLQAFASEEPDVSAHRPAAEGLVRPSFDADTLWDDAVSTRWHWSSAFLGGLMLGLIIVGATAYATLDLADSLIVIHAPPNPVWAPPTRVAAEFDQQPSAAPTRDAATAVRTVASSSSSRGLTSDRARPREWFASSRSGSLEIRSWPARADVLLDGTHLGRTPLSILVDEGTHRITLRFPGFKHWETQLNMKVGHRARVTASLEPA